MAHTEFKIESIVAESDVFSVHLTFPRKDDGNPELNYDGGFDGLARKEPTHEAVQIFREQIVDAFRQVEGTPRSATSADRWGVRDATFYACKKEYANLGVSKLHRQKTVG